MLQIEAQTGRGRLQKRRLGKAWKTFERKQRPLIYNQVTFYEAWRYIIALFCRPEIIYDIHKQYFEAGVSVLFPIEVKQLLHFKISQNT